MIEHTGPGIAWWATFSGFIGVVLGFAIATAFVRNLVLKNCEWAVRRDFRVSLDRKAAIIARMRGCPVEWVLEELLDEDAKAKRCIFDSDD